MTTLQFPAPDRVGAPTDLVRTRRLAWEEFVRRPDAHDRLQELAAAALRRDVLEYSAFASRLLGDVPILVADRDSARNAQRLAEAEVARLEAEVAALRTAGPSRRNDPLGRLRRRASRRSADS
jgi:hypothetical protein